MERITVSANGHFLITEHGEPFFWLADTAWELFQRLDREETALYLETRRQQGFNVIQVVTATELQMSAPNRYGHPVFVGTDPVEPNDAYFQHVDWVFDLAQEKGLYIAFLPTWGDKVNDQGSDTPALFDVRSAYSYGAWLAQRYGQRPNLIWVLGGDRLVVENDRDFAPVWRAMAVGIRQYSSALMTFHPRGWHGSAADFHHEPWMGFNMWQSGHSELDTPNWDWISADYSRLPPKPVLDAEPCYEDSPIDPFLRLWQPEYGRFTAHDVRKAAYRAVFAGACGHTYGHHSVWQFYDDPREPINFPYPDWRTALQRTGAWQMGHLRRLMHSFPYLTRIPDQSLLVAPSLERAQHPRATRDSAGRYALVYMPWRGTVEVDLRVLAADTFSVAWFDPREGTTQRIADAVRGPRLRFTTPGGLNTAIADWVLIITSLHESRLGEPGGDHAQHNAHPDDIVGA